MSAVVLPLPIPNREVKPERADGTATYYAGEQETAYLYLNVLSM